MAIRVPDKLKQMNGNTYPLLDVLDMEFNEYNSSIPYTQGQCITRNGCIYRAVVDTIPEAFDDTKWEIVVGNELLSDLSEGGIRQVIYENVSANDTFVIDDIKSDKVIIQPFKISMGNADIIETIKAFNQTNKNGIYCDKDMVDFTTNYVAPKLFENSYAFTEGTNGVYETELIDMTGMVIDVLEVV